MSAAHSFKRIFGTRNLREIFVHRVQDTGAIGIDRIHPSRYSKYLVDEVSLIQRKVKSKSYRFTSYKEKLISKGANDAPRVISIPTVRDRIVLRGICDLLVETFPAATPEIPQVRIEALKEQLQRGMFAEFVKIDLRQFYPSIPHTSLLNILQGKIRKTEIITLIQDAIATPTVPSVKGGKGAARNAKGVPQGLSISNLLAEIYLSKFDAEIAALSNIWFCRYVDDILILCTAGQSKSIAESVCKRLEKWGLNPHRLGAPDSKSKSGSLKDEFDFLGYQVRDGKISIRKASIHKLEGALAGICTAYRHKMALATKAEDVTRARALCEWRLNLRITGCIFDRKRLGWMFYFSQVTDTSRIRAVDNTVQQLLDRFALNGVIRAKRLLKTYYECHRKDKSDHKYIPNFDEIDITGQRKILSLLLGHGRIARVTDKRVQELFRMNIRKAVKELEEDLAGLS
jgi:RNA-directed DNA polymerase